MNPTQQPITSFCFDQMMIDVAYAFSPYHARNSSMHTAHVFLDILFVHPRTSEPVSMRVTAMANLLCKPRDVIEAAVYEEIRNALYFPGAECSLFAAGVA